MPVVALLAFSPSWPHLSLDLYPLPSEFLILDLLLLHHLGPLPSSSAPCGVCANDMWKLHVGSFVANAAVLES